MKKQNYRRYCRVYLPTTAVLQISRQACIDAAEAIGRAEGVPGELLSLHCADATRPGIFDDLELAAVTVVFVYAYPTLLAQLQVTMKS